MSRILVTYATMAGSTAEVAATIADEIRRSGAQVDLMPLEAVVDVNGYDGVVVGGPMIMGWHRSATRFLKKHRKSFERIPLAVFILAMSLTKTKGTFANGLRIDVDENLAKPPVVEGRLSFRERYTTLGNYLRPIFGATRPAKPVRIAVFGGRLEFGRLKWWAILFAALIIGAVPGDRRNWSAIRAWAAELAGEFPNM